MKSSSKKLIWSSFDIITRLVNSQINDQVWSQIENQESASQQVQKHVWFQVRNQIGAFVKKPERTKLAIKSGIN